MTRVRTFGSRRDSSRRGLATSIETSALVSLLIGLLVSGCSDLDAPKSAKIEARSPEEAVSKLSESSRQTFQSWKARAIKSCEPGEAFGIESRVTGGRKDYEGVDGAALLKANGESLVFKDGVARVVLTDHDSFSGQGTSKVEQTISVNGESQMLSAETRRSGSSCELYLYGQKVFETQIFQSFTIGLEIRSGKQASLMGAPVQVTPIGQAGYSVSEGVPVLELVNEVFRPGKEASDFFSRSLNLSKERAAQLFKIGRAGVKIAKIANEPSAIWSIADSRGLIAFQSVLERYLRTPNSVLPLEVRLEIPRMKIADVENKADRAFWSLGLDIAVQANDKQTGISLANFDDRGLQPHRAHEALQCVESRVEAFVKSNGAETVNLQPSVPFMFDPCRVIDPKVETLAFDTGLMKSLLPIVFANVTPARFAQYGGWDDVLRQIAKETVKAGKDLRAELDPSSKARVVPTLATHLESLKSGLSRSSHLKPFEPTITEIGYRWTFAGYQISSSRIDEILHSLDQSIVPFEVSTLRLFDDLSSQPNAFDEQVRFANLIDDSYRNVALRALQLADDLGFKTFRQEVFNVVLQRQVKTTELNDWITKLRDIRYEIEPFKKLGGQKDRLVALSVKWLRSQEVTRAQLRSVYAAVDRSAAPFAESTRTMLNDLSRSYADGHEAVEFAATAINPEYEALASSIQNLAKRAEYERWGDALISTILQKRPSLQQLKSWNEMWSAIVAFNQREAVRVKDEFGSTNDWNRKEIVEVAVKETWTNADFVSLETIAEVARYKTSCERHKGMSSLANCAGRSLFSRQKGLFFDPTFDGRYSKFARDLGGLLSQFSEFDAYSLKSKVTGKFFGSWAPIFSKCDKASFERNAHLVTSTLKQLKIEKDQFKKWDLERQLDKSLEDCQ